MTPLSRRPLPITHATLTTALGTGCAALRSACHWASTVCNTAVLSICACVMSRLRMRLSSPRQLKPASIAMRVMAMSSSMSVKPRCGFMATPETAANHLCQCSAKVRVCWCWSWQH